jgi:hypothetical protein
MPGLYFTKQSISKSLTIIGGFLNFKMVQLFGMDSIKITGKIWPRSSLACPLKFNVASYNYYDKDISADESGL